MRLAAGLLMAAALATAPAARAERADKDKPLNYEADTGECDDLQQVCTLAGNVVLVKGTMRATGDRVVIRKDPEGFQFGQIVGAPGRPATFRQRRDGTQAGVEEYVDGVAERIEYDERADTVKLLSRARVRLLENDVTRDELSGDAITYDQRNSKYFVTGGKGAATANNPDGRVRGTIAPRGSAPKAGTPAPLKPAAGIAAPRE
jgi:lipopolysaccharide export system protein LptA